MTATDERCPKRMAYGPCGGVGPDGTCEVDVRPCPFAGRAAPVPWVGPTSPAPPFAVGSEPFVLADLTVAPFDPTSVARTVATMAPACDAVLVGEHQSRPDLPPTQMVPLVRAAGAEPIVTLSCRDRNRVVLEQELRGLAALDVAGVLCVTGDARAPGVRHDVTQVFDLDGHRLAALAAEVGVPVVVPESPDAPPTAIRPGRVAEKERAGARLCVLNHCASVDGVRHFAAAARRAGATIPFVAAVAVFTDAASAAVLQAFPGLDLPDGTVAAVLGATDPFAAGVEVAVAEARQLLEIPGVVGVNLSGRASTASIERGAEAKAAVGAAIKAGP